jgi:L-alanine-DL-glutamate epimerase-like enolase superfamily enzyme
MKISAVETVAHEDYPHLIEVLVHTDEGLSGIGETYFNRDAIGVYVHSTIAPKMIGESATNIARAWQQIGLASDGRQPWSGTTSVNSSATAAFDMAMWDLRAKVQGVPLHEALGGAVRDRIRVYNTCADPGHLPPRGTPEHERHLHEDWGLGPRTGPYDDYTASLERPAELARDLLESGITAMKIFPFMRLARETKGVFITPQQLDENLEPFRQIRAAVGSEMDLCVDLANMWTYGAGLRIARALEQFDLMWIEDPLRLSATRSVAHLARVITTPIAGYDYRAGLAPYIDLIESGAISIVRLAPEWAGGLTEAKRIAGYAEARGLGIAFHDTGGPVQWASNIHLALHLPNSMVIEMVRAYHHGAYPSIARTVPEVVDGHALPLPGPGHGVELLPAYLEQARRRRSTVRDGRFVTEEVTP